MTIGRPMVDITEDDDNVYLDGWIIPKGEAAKIMTSEKDVELLFGKCMRYGNQKTQSEVFTMTK